MTPADFDRMPLQDMVDRYLDLSLRDFTAIVTGVRLTAAEHVELLALGVAVARHVTNGRQVGVWHALRAGATWPQIAAASGTDEPTARRAFRDWIDGQAALWDSTALPGELPIGLSHDDRAHARRFLDTPSTDREEHPTTR